MQDVLDQGLLLVVKKAPKVEKGYARTNGHGHYAVINVSIRLSKEKN